MKDERLRRLQHSLDECDEQLRRALESVGLGTWEWTPSTGEFICSPRGRALQGLAADAVLDFEAFMACVHAEDRDAMIGAMHEALREGTSIGCAYRAVGADGVVRSLHSRGRVIEAGVRGAAMRITGVLQEVTAASRPAADARHAAGPGALRSLARHHPAQAWSLRPQLRDAADAAPLAIVALDESGAIRYANAPWHELTGLGAERALHLPFLDTVLDADREPVARALRDVPRPGGALSFRQLRAGGDALWLDAQLLGLFDEFGALQGQLIIANDATLRMRERTAAAQRLEQLRQLAGHLDWIRALERLELADSLRQDVHGELCQVDATLLALAGDAGLPAATRDSLQRLSRRTQQLQRRLDSMVTDLTPLGSDERDLGGALRRYLDEQRTCDGLQFSLQVPDNLDGVGRDTLVALYGAIREAVGNAAEHALASRIDVAVELRPDAIRARISDDGIGIDDAERRKPGHYGLVVAGERLAQVQGVLRVFGLPGRGTVVEASVPLRR